MAKSFTLHDLPSEEKPRERLKKVGVDNLSIQELLALIIERGKKGQNVLTVAQNLLAHFGNLARIKEASIEELQEIKGVGFATACKLKAAFKLGEKTLSEYKRYNQKIEIPEDVYGLFKSKLGNKKKEHLELLSLTSRNRLISIDEISIGSLDTNIVHPREVFAPAITNSASTVVLVHNHPSGDPTPSEKDLEITKMLAKIGRMLNIEIIDHIIVTSKKFVSLKTEHPALFI